jgi:uncharacterized protein (TIGR00375 family)
VEGRLVMKVYADLHVHVGRTEEGIFIKVSASRNLTLLNILEKSIFKGIDIVGVVDCASPHLISEIKKYQDEGILSALEGGGMRYKDRVTLILGSEIEIGGEEKGSPHLIAYFKTLEDISLFSEKISRYMKNVNLSSQRVNINSQEAVEIMKSCNGIPVPAHVFTPFKSYYGSSTDRLNKVFKDFCNEIDAVELGLSADSDMADQIAELSSKTFLSNSDAHSLEKIAREFNVLEIEEANFEEVLLALRREKGRKVLKNYGLDPKLGKYHRTFCLECGYIAKEPPPVTKCPKCGSERVVMGVRDRIEQIKDHDTIHPPFRSPYIYQIPLEFIPNIGKKTIKKLVDYFGSELYALHEATYEELKKAVGEKIALNILKARNGEISIAAGGGGIYGKVFLEN